MKYTLKKSGSASNRINAIDENGNKLFVIEAGYSEDNLVDREIINLIDAAPDLLETLQELKGWFDCGNHCESGLYEKIELAIAKALD